MCRHNMLLGCVMVVLGSGLLIGKWVGGGFLFHCLCLGMIFAGSCLLRKK